MEIGLEVSLADGSLEVEVVKHEIVQEQDPRNRQGEPIDLQVVSIVPHVVEGNSLGWLQRPGRDQGPPLSDFGRGRLAGKMDQPKIAVRRHVWQHVQRVVRDPGAYRRKGRDPVQRRRWGRHDFPIPGDTRGSLVILGASGIESSSGRLGSGTCWIN